MDNSALKTAEIICSVTGKTVPAKQRTDGESALPKGWKRIGGAVYSPEGLQQRFVLRSVHLPVASVLCGYDGDDWSIEQCKAGWIAFRAALRKSCQQARFALNWAFQELAKSDNDPLVPGERGFKLPKWSAASVDLYTQGRIAFPEIDSQSLGSLLVLARSKYTQTRFERRVLGKVGAMSFRADMVPLPIPAKDARLTVNDQHQPFFRVRIGGERFTIRLRNTPKRKHFCTYWQVRSLERIVAGEAEQGEVKLFDRGAEVMAMIACYLPIEDRGERTEKVCRVTTQKEKLWMVSVDGRDEPWNLNDDQVQRRISAHRTRLQRLNEDSKFERRSHRHVHRTSPHAFRELLCDKQNRWLNDYCHKASAMLVGLARRHGCGTIEYGDVEQSFAGSFPWFKLRGLVEQKCKVAGITFVHVSGSEEKSST